MANQIGITVSIKPSLNHSNEDTTIIGRPRFCRERPCNRILSRLISPVSIAARTPDAGNWERPAELPNVGALWTSCCGSSRFFSSWCLSFFSPWQPWRAGQARVRRRHGPMDFSNRHHCPPSQNDCRFFAING
jgi:hypothetical protein